MLPPFDSPNEVRRFNRREYNALGQLGIFKHEKVELLRGVIVKMSPAGNEHANAYEWLTRRLIRGLDDEYRVRPACPFAASDDSEPEPDLLVTLEPFGADHPSTAVLVIEVSDSSLRKDRMIKQSIYAEAAVPEYWVVNVAEPDVVTVEVYSEPSGERYAKLVTLRDGDVLRPLLVPIEIAVADIPR